MLGCCKLVYVLLYSTSTSVGLGWSILSWNPSYMYVCTLQCQLPSLFNSCICHLGSLNTSSHIFNESSCIFFWWQSTNFGTARRCKPTFKFVFTKFHLQKKKKRKKKKENMSRQILIANDPPQLLLTMLYCCKMSIMPT